MPNYSEMVLRLLLSRNTAPSTDERQMIPGEAHETPCRAFSAVADWPPRLTYVTASGQTNTRRVQPYANNPIQITQIVAIEPHPREPADVPVEVWAVW